MSNQHTPGPWVIRERADQLHITPADNEFFMCAAVSGFNQAEALANARLIAAAPDLLKALITLRNDCWNKEGELIEPTELVLDMVDELIKKFPSANL